MNVQDSEIKNLMLKYKKIVVYGLSPDPEKPSHYVPLYMKEKGWDVVGVYPKHHAVNGFKIYSKLSEVPKDFIKFIDVFRASDRIPEVVDEVLQIGSTEAMWLQLGISNADAESRAEKAGLKVVSNRCLIPEHKRWF